MRKIVLLLVTVFVFAVGANAQTSNTTDQDLKDCSQFLDQSIAEQTACGNSKNLLERLLAKTEQLLLKEEAISAERQQTTKSQAKTIERLEQVKCSTLSFFFGLIKKKNCF